LDFEDNSGEEEKVGKEKRKEKLEVDNRVNLV